MASYPVQIGFRYVLFAVVSISQLTLALAQASASIPPAPAPAPANSSAPSIGLYQAHGILMFLGFGLLLPIGIIIARHAQSFTRFWFHLHWILQIIALCCVVPAFAIAIHYFAALADSLHAKLGVAVFILVAIQPLLAVVRPHKGNLYRPLWYFFHWMFGTTAVLLGWHQIYSGLQLYSVDWCTNDCTSHLQHWFTGLLAVLSFVYLLLGRWEHMMSQITGDARVDGFIHSSSKRPQAVGQHQGENGGHHPSLAEGRVEEPAMECEV